MLQNEGIDFLEISGGNYEAPVIYGSSSKKESTVSREAYFLDYARDTKAALHIPVMVTGGFRSLSIMNRALADGAADLILTRVLEPPEQGASPPVFLDLHLSKGAR